MSQWIVCIFMGLISAVMLLSVHLLLQSSIHPPYIDPYIGYGDYCGFYTESLFPYSLLCFPIVMAVAVGFNREFLLGQPFDFLTQSFFWYQLVLISALLCALNGIEPFVWLGARGARLGADNISLVLQTLSIVLSVLVVVVVGKLYSIRVWPPQEKGRLFGNCLLIILMGLAFNAIWFVVPKRVYIRHYVGTKADLHMENQLAIAELRKRTPLKDKNSEEFKSYVISLANCLSAVGKSSEALETLQQAAKDISRLDLKAQIYDELARKSTNLKNHQKAYEYYQLELDCLRQVNGIPAYRVADCLQSLARVAQHVNSKQTVLLLKEAADIRARTR